MWCPNVNSPDFKKQKEFLGEDLAYHLWDKNKGFPLHLTDKGEPSKLFESLKAELGEKGAYEAKSKIFTKGFREKYGEWTDEPMFTTVKDLGKDKNIPKFKDGSYTEYQAKNNIETTSNKLFKRIINKETGSIVRSDIETNQEERAKYLKEHEQNNQAPEDGQKAEGEDKGLGKVKPLLDVLQEAKNQQEEGSKYISPESFNVKTFDEFDSALSKGEVSVDEFKKAFKSLIASRDTIISELNGKTKAQLLESMSAMGRSRYKNEKKDRIINALWDNNEMSFVFGMFSYSHGEKVEDVIAKRVEKTTQEDLNKYAEESQKRKEDYLNRLKEYKKGLTNPETLPEFKIFIEHNGVEKLSPEQKEKYDNLITDNVIDKRNQGIEKKDIIGKVDLAGVDMDITETKHTKTGADLFVVKLSSRISPEDYKDLNSKAKQLGGYYSSYHIGGAVPGFQFKTKEQAQKFIDLKKTDVSNIDKIEEKQEVKVQNNVSKLRDNAQNIIDRVDAELSKDRLTNTPKRAREASSTEAKLNKEKQIAQTMLNIADAIEDGDVKLLDGIKAKTHIELLDGLILDAQRKEIQSKFPNLSYSERMSHDGDLPTIGSVDYLKEVFYPKIYSEHIKSLISKVEHKSGVKLASARWAKRLANSKDRDYFKTSRQDQIDDLTDMVNALPESDKRHNRVADEIADFNRLKSMGIENDSMLRAALR